MSICVIIPMHGLPEMTKKCVDDTIKNAGVECDVLVVDDGSPEPFQYDKAQVLRLEKNSGFTGATNAGILWAMDRNYDYVLLLNNDTEPYPDFIKLLLEVLQKDLNIGIAASTREILNDKGVPWIENFGIDLITGYQAYTEKDLPQDTVDVAWIPVCSALIPMPVVKQVGLLDRRMKLYCSDNDYCIRMHLLGYRVVLVPKSKIKHFHQKTTEMVGVRYAEAERDQKILIGKLCCHLQIQLLDNYPLDWKAKTWGKLTLDIYQKSEDPIYSDAVVLNDKINQPATT